MTATRHTNYTFDGYDPDDGLTDGRWVRDGLVVRWEAGDPEAEHMPAPKTLNMHLLIACPTCLAPADQGCRTVNGNPAGSHAARLVARRCYCGRPAARSSHYCEPCQVEQRRARWREARARYVAKRKDDAA